MTDNLLKEESTNFLFFVNAIFTVLFINYLAVIWIAEYELEPREKDFCTIGFVVSIIYFFLKSFWVRFLLELREIASQYEIKKIKDEQI